MIYEVFSAESEHLKLQSLHEVFSESGQHFQRSSEKSIGIKLYRFQPMPLPFQAFRGDSGPDFNRQQS